MQRILVDVNVPGAGTHYEVRIPEKIYIQIDKFAN